MYRPIALIYSHLLCIQLFAQNQIHGIVTDDRGSAIVFATISTLSGKGTSSDSLGNFILGISEDERDRTIIAQAIGYVTDTLLLADNKTDLEFRLEKIHFQLKEVAIVSHRDIESKSTVSAFSTNKKEMAQQNSQNVSQVLQTKFGFTNKSGYQSPLILRGMSGKRILILRNGNRRFSSYPSGVMLHTINVYDLS